MATPTKEEIEEIYAEETEAQNTWDTTVDKIVGTD